MGAKREDSGGTKLCVSAENEPDSCGINKTTSYSAAQLATWIETLGPAMANISVKVMAPDTMNACGFTSLLSGNQSRLDRLERREHLCEPRIWVRHAAFRTDHRCCRQRVLGKQRFDTGTASGDSTGDGIASALLMAQTMHNDLTKPNLNAWHLWWVYNASGNGGCLYDTSTKGVDQAPLGPG